VFVDLVALTCKDEGDLGKIKNRIIGSGEEQLDQIMFNPRNWRIHPLSQQDALKGVLEEVGWVQEVIVNKRTGHLVDGHLRCQLAAREGAKTIPVKYVDLSEDEEALVLATLDPIGAMAATDRQKMSELMEMIKTEDERVQKMVSDLAEDERTFQFDESDLIDSFSEGIDREINDFSAITMIFDSKDAELVRSYIAEKTMPVLTAEIVEMIKNA